MCLNERISFAVELKNKNVYCWEKELTVLERTLGIVKNIVVVTTTTTRSRIYRRFNENIDILAEFKIKWANVFNDSHKKQQEKGQKNEGVIILYETWQIKVFSFAFTNLLKLDYNK